MRADVPDRAGGVPQLGVRSGPNGGSIGVFSASATAIELRVFGADDPERMLDRVALTRDDSGVWSGRSPALIVGASYSLRADGPPAGPDHRTGLAHAADVGVDESLPSGTGPIRLAEHETEDETEPALVSAAPRACGAPASAAPAPIAPHRFDPDRDLLDPHARGVLERPDGAYRGVVVEESFDWGDSRRPAVPLDHAIVYEAHVKGLTKRFPGVPTELQGTYAGLAHPAVIEHLRALGVTTVELLPIHRFATEQRLLQQGRVNYWGYNTLAFFAPHDAYATAAARAEGPGAVLREVKQMVRDLHEAGLEVVLDVVYNHTAEQGMDLPTLSLRGLDNAVYYRHDGRGSYVDTTGCGNTLNTAEPAAAQLVLDSLRFWADEVQVDGFRFDLAAALGRDASHTFDPAHPLLTAMLADPSLRGLKLIAEPWDVGMGGWQTGAFPLGFLEWNDGFRDRMRDFWLTDAAAEARHGNASVGIGPMIGRLAGSADAFSPERGPLTSVNFVTAHDGFTLADLAAYDEKHNLDNGEDNRDGSNDNRSYNHGFEGDTDDAAILTARQSKVRALLGGLLFSTGVPMLTAGDEIGRSQRGNNNAYNTDGELTWLDWELRPWQRELLETARLLLRMRREHPALRPVRFGAHGGRVPSANRIEWFNRMGLPMGVHDWDSPGERTVQYLGESTPEIERASCVLLVIHGRGLPVEAVLPAADGITSFTRCWDSAPAAFDAAGERELTPGDTITVAPWSVQLFSAS